MFADNLNKNWTKISRKTEIFPKGETSEGTKMGLPSPHTSRRSSHPFRYQKHFPRDLGNTHYQGIRPLRTDNLSVTHPETKETQVQVTDHRGTPAKKWISIHDGHPVPSLIELDDFWPHQVQLSLRSASVASPCLSESCGQVRAVVFTGLCPMGKIRII